ncbi:hypothetical protein, partial [Escherichia coli]|uniref:hypothetical protein n=1 Tax=Escherichia coli TaxID=562 RepID=UPI0028FC3AA3
DIGSNIKFRRLAACLLGACLFAVALAGCSRGEAPKPRPEPKREAIRLDYWTPFSGGDNQFMTEMVERFNTEQDDILVVQTNTR